MAKLGIILSIPAHVDATGYAISQMNDRNTFLSVIPEERWST